jgi:Mce-associated membrane protein
MSKSTIYHTTTRLELTMPGDTATVLDVEPSAQAETHTDLPGEGTTEADDSSAVLQQTSTAEENGPAESAAEEDPAEPSRGEEPVGQTRSSRWQRFLAYALLPGLALTLAIGAGYLKWWGPSANDMSSVRAQSVQAATEGTVALLSYRPDNVDTTLGAARERLTGDFRDAYTKLVNDVVIPGAKQKQVTAVATVAAAASMSASETHAVALVFVDQTVTVGTEAPTDTASSVRVTLDKVHDRWLISQFEPI